MLVAAAALAGCMQTAEVQETTLAQMAALPTPTGCKVPDAVSSGNAGLSVDQVITIWPKEAHGSRGVLERLRTGTASQTDLDYARSCLGLTTV